MENNLFYMLAYKNISQISRAVSYFRILSISIDEFTWEATSHCKKRTSPLI